MATGGRDRNAKAARERARLYQARQELHASKIRRRTRDNVIAGVVSGVIVLAAIGSQVVYFTVGPGAPAPVASVAPTPEPTTQPSETPAPDASTPAATPTP